MDVERVKASDVRIGDVVATNDQSGWWSVEHVRSDASADRTFVLVALEGDRDTTEGRIAASTYVRRIDPTAVHHVNEFVGLDLEHARAWAGAIGWRLRHATPGAFFTDEEAQNRVTVRTDECVVVAAEMG